MIDFSRPALSRYITDDTPSAGGLSTRWKPVDMTAPKSDMEKAAERYITSRADFEFMKSQTYLREYYLDIRDL